MDVDHAHRYIHAPKAACIKGKDTKPEMLIRRGLLARGLRYRLHDRSLPGRPDLVFPKYRTAVFIHGCFWHAHGCALSKLPATRQDFWRTKLAANAARDGKAVDALQTAGWRVLVIRECALRGSGRLPEDEVLNGAAHFARNGADSILDISGQSIDQGGPKVTTGTPNLPTIYKLTIERFRGVS